MELKNLLNEEQNPKDVEKLMGKLTGILMNDEEVEYIAVQKKPAINLSPDCVALTNKRIIFCRPKSLGLGMEFQDYIWRDIADSHLKENIFGSTFSIRTTTNNSNHIDYLPKGQARRLYTFAQEQEEVQNDIRRERELEEKRASAGNVTFAPSTSASPQPNVATYADDPLETLKKLKGLLDIELITEEEYNLKKNEILARM